MLGWTLDPELLQTFLAVRRHRNLTRAAEELFVSQPAVSRRLERLERSLGLRLFERLGKTLSVTDAGEALAAEAVTLLGSLERIGEVMHARRSGEHGRIRIGASSTPGLYLLPRVVQAFQRRFPRVAVQYTVENSLRIEERLVRNELDVGFTGAHLTHAALRLRPLCEDEIVLYAARTHPLARRRAIAARDLEDDRCLVREAGSATRALVDRWLRRAGATLRDTVEVACPEAARVLVRAGLGFSYTSLAALKSGGGVRRLDVAGLRLVRPIYVAMHADKHVNRPLQAFLDAAAAAQGTVVRQ